MPLSDFFKKNWIGILGVIIGIFGIAISVIFYSKSISKREACFVVAPDRNN